MSDKVYGQVTYMVRCCAEKDGRACGGMIDIPSNGKGQCPRCGCLRGLAEYRAERGKIRVKRPVETLGVKQ